MSAGAVVDVRAIEAVFAEQYGRAVAVLIRVFGDIDIAEDAVQDAFAAALRHWPAEGLPPAPAGWIITTARRRAVDRLRREAARAGKYAQAALTHAEDEADPYDVPDDRLRLIFTCCHPALAMPARVALTLRLLGGLGTPALARAFLISETAMAQRLSRAKGKIRAAGIPYRVPGATELPQRLPGVLAVLYLIYTEGHTTSTGPAATRADLCAEAIRLARLLTELLPGEPEAIGLLALLLLSDARRRARIAADGSLIPLARQDRRHWDAALLDEGRSLVRECLRRNRPGPYQIQAAINAVHADAATTADTDWAQIVRLYDHLAALAPSPVVTLNRAVAVAEIDGPAAALALVDELDLPNYHLYHAVRGELLDRLGRSAEAATAFELALEHTENPAERDHLRERRRQLDRRPR
ncbi:RNA polymerase sigma factor [Nocardia aurantia]|uniref:RNA polymerase subunit sigma-24 n=1 Tax=Nocardia aurantia TaxID=2585199 RepID=A0A7K0DMA7_9NOCA|nr:DUF6596 domain-containing protein [Nocardia aurantia]MQY26828.1 hypothetical protein [Nocardia aurantia]